MLALIACAAPGDAPRRLALRSPAAQRLTGSWSVRLALDAGAARAMPAAPPALARGTLILTADQLGHVATVRLPGATHGGVYEIDVAGLGFVPDVEEPVPVAVARVVPGRAGGSPDGTRVTPDSVFIVLSPAAERLAIYLAGEMRGDSITGRWRAESFSAGGRAGTFAMHRQGAGP